MFPRNISEIKSLFRAVPQGTPFFSNRKFLVSPFEICFQNLCLFGLRPHRAGRNYWKKSGCPLRYSLPWARNASRRKALRRLLWNYPDRRQRKSQQRRQRIALSSGRIRWLPEARKSWASRRTRRMQSRCSEVLPMTAIRSIRVSR